MNTKRITSIAVLIAALAAGLAPLPGCGGGDPEPIPVILIVFDALRPDHTGLDGYRRNTTPTLNRLARDGVVFDQASAQAAFTLPSMATLFTGLHPYHHGVRRHLDHQGRADRLAPERTTLAETLNARGYATAAVVSNSLFQLDTGFDQGFDHFNAGRRRDAGPTTDAALAWLKARPKDRPFFLWIHYIDPHWPYDAPNEYARPFSHDDRGEYAAALRAFERGRLSPGRLYFENPFSPDGVQRAVAEYDNEIAYADRELSRLIRYLKKEGLYEKALIVAVSDHGESLGEHGLHFAHSFNLYEPVQRVLFVVKPPGAGGDGRRDGDRDGGPDRGRVDTGRDARWISDRGRNIDPEGPLRIDVPVRLLDLAPTVHAQLGLPRDPGWEGEDLSLLFAEGAASDPSPAPGRLSDLPVYAESEPRYRTRDGTYRYPERRRSDGSTDEGRWRMLRIGRYKLLRIPGEGFELYDLKEDPGEIRNLADAEPDRAEALKRMLEGLLEGDRGDGDPAGTPLDHDAEARRRFREMGY